MNLNYNYLREQKRLIPLALLGISAASAVLILIKTTSFFVASARAETLVKRAVSQAEPNTEAMKECEAKYRAIADNLKKSNLFSPPVPEHNPVSAVLGILGDEALIEDKWYKAGDKVGEATIVAVEAAQVRIAWHGQEKVFTPIDGTTEPASDGPRRTRRDAKAVAQNSKSRDGAAEMVLIGQTGNIRTDGKPSKEKTAAAYKKAEKLKMSASEKDSQKRAKGLTKNTQTDRNKASAEKKKSPANDKNSGEKAAQQKIKKPVRK